MVKPAPYWLLSNVQLNCAMGASCIALAYGVRHNEGAFGEGPASKVNLVSMQGGKRCMKNRGSALSPDPFSASVLNSSWKMAGGRLGFEASKGGMVDEVPDWNYPRRSSGWLNRVIDDIFGERVNSRLASTSFIQKYSWTSDR